MNKGKVLVILSSTSQLELQDGKVLNTGFFLNEFGIPARRLVDAGYELVLANPQGNRPAMDASSDDASFFGKDEHLHQQIKSFVHGLPGFEKPKTLQAVLEGGLDSFVGIFVPGGHAPMVDLISDVQLGQILRHFHKEGKPTAMICHGPAATLSAQTDPIGFVAAQKAGRDTPAQDWIYAGYAMTVLSNLEERLTETNLPAKLQFHIESALKKAGAKMDVAWIPQQSKVVQDRELITGQNPFSDEQLSTQFLNMLMERAHAGSQR